MCRVVRVDAGESGRQCPVTAAAAGWQVTCSQSQRLPRPSSLLSRLQACPLLRCPVASSCLRASASRVRSGWYLPAVVVWRFGFSLGVLWPLVAVASDRPELSDLRSHWMMEHSTEQHERQQTSQQLDFSHNLSRSLCSPLLAAHTGHCLSDPGRQRVNSTGRCTFPVSIRESVCFTQRALVCRRWHVCASGTSACNAPCPPRACPVQMRRALPPFQSRHDVSPSPTAPTSAIYTYPPTPSLDPDPPP